jgi:hypothetical protein
VYEDMAVKLWWCGGELAPLEEGGRGDFSAEQEEDIFHEECEDFDDYMDLFGQLRNAFGLLCSAAAQACPEAAAGALYREVHGVLVERYEGVAGLCVQLQQGGGGGVLSDEVHGSLQRFVLRLEALAPLVEGIVRAACTGTTHPHGSCLPSFLSLPLCLSASLSLCLSLSHTHTHTHTHH